MAGMMIGTTEMETELTKVALALFLRVQDTVGFLINFQEKVLKPNFGVHLLIGPIYTLGVCLIVRADWVLIGEYTIVPFLYGASKINIV